MSEVADILDALADEETARRAGRHTRSLRGIRGVPHGDVARVTAELYQADPPSLPRDADELNTTFGGAWEDGLVAIGLLATAVPEDPATAMSLGLDWAGRTDDVTTADALGWLVLAPACLVLNDVRGPLGSLGDHFRAETRRVVVSMGLGWTPTPIEGPSAAALREKVGERQVRMVEDPVPAWLGPLAARFVRDDAPVVQKGLRRVLRAWGQAEPEELVDWASTVRGGLPRLLTDEVDRYKGRRR